MLGVAASLNAFAWGQKGHDVVAYIAECHLTPTAAEKVAAVLGGRSLVYYSNWMDNASHTPEYAHTKTWHYMNIDEGETFESQPRHPQGDVVTAINSIVKEIEKGKWSEKEHFDGLRMLIHLVGDMHCPMHAGRLSDVGGNRTKVKWFGRQTNLHSVWDSKIVESARSWSYSEWRDHLDIINYGTTTGYYTGTWVEEVRSGIISDDSGKPFSTDFYEKWFAETVANAAQIYDYVEALGEENPNLSYQFVYDFSTMLENSLQHGGYRLAHVLNSIFDPEGAKQVLIEFAFY